MKISIVHENDGYSLYVDEEFYGKYDSPIQAAQAVEEMNLEDNDK